MAKAVAPQTRKPAAPKARATRSASGKLLMAPKPAKKPPAKAKAQPNRFIGSGFDEFLEQEGILAEVDAVAIRRVIVWELSRAMKAKGVSKSRLATLMGTSRTQIDRLLDADENVTIEAVSRAAAALGLQLTVSLT